LWEMSPPGAELRCRYGAKPLPQKMYITILVQEFAIYNFAFVTTSNENTF